MVCNIGDMQDQEVATITVTVKADGNNFDGNSKQSDVLNNKATLTCRTSATATGDDSRCTKSDDVDVTVGGGAAVAVVMEYVAAPMCCVSWLCIAIRIDISSTV